MSDEIVSIYYKVISSNTSRKIVLILGEEKSLRATELIQTLKVSPGTFYDALKKLKEVVEKTEDGQYQLTSLGRKIYYMLLDESKGFQSYPSSLVHVVSSMPFLFPLSFLRRIGSLSPSMFLFFIGSIVTSGIIGSMLSRLIPVLLFCLPSYLVLNPPYFTILFVLNAIFLVSLTYLFTNLFGEVSNSLKFCLVSLISLAPNIAFSFIYYLFYNNFFIHLSFLTYLLIFLIPLFFSFTILTSVIFANASMRIEASFMISLMILFISLILSEVLLEIIFNL